MSDVEDVFVSEEAQVPKVVKCDPRPSQEEVDKHNVTHLPYRSWCPHCIRGKAKRRAHRKRVREKRQGIPVISLDYMWMKGKKEEEDTEQEGNPIMVAHCRDTKLAMSKVVLKKGVDPYSVKVITDMIGFTGHRKVILKSDGESSITALKNTVRNACEVNMGVEVSPVGDSQANGEVERAIRTVQ